MEARRGYSPIYGRQVANVGNLEIDPTEAQIVTHQRANIAKANVRDQILYNAAVAHGYKGKQRPAIDRPKYNLDNFVGLSGNYDGPLGSIHGTVRNNGAYDIKGENNHNQYVEYKHIPHKNSIITAGLNSPEYNAYIRSTQNVNGDRYNSIGGSYQINRDWKAEGSIDQDPNGVHEKANLIYKF